MTDADRYGPYATPRVPLGEVLSCEVRDCEVVVVNYSDAPISWPIGQRRGRGARALVVCGQLANAVRREANQAAAHWWGVTPQTMTKWRKALDVPRANEGTHRLHHDSALTPGVAAGREKAHALPVNQKRTRAGGRRSRWPNAASRSAEVTEALHRANQSRPLGQEHRRKMSEAHRRRGTRPPAARLPWTVEEDELLRILPARDVAERTGRTLTAVYIRRVDLGIPDGRRREQRA